MLLLGGLAREKKRTKTGGKHPDQYYFHRRDERSPEFLLINAVSNR
jgi:hypothetical protein